MLAAAAAAALVSFVTLHLEEVGCVCVCVCVQSTFTRAEAIGRLACRFVRWRAGGSVTREARSGRDLAGQLC